jgi:hypothetical protein
LRGISQLSQPGTVAQIACAQTSGTDAGLLMLASISFICLPGATARLIPEIGRDLPVQLRETLIRSFIQHDPIHTIFDSASSPQS